MSLITSQKVTYKRVRPNPLFEDWLNCMYEEAKRSKSKMEPILKEALFSLSKYPVPLKSGSECIILKGFGKELCKYLDICLERYSNYTSASACSSNDNRNSHTDTPLSSISCNVNNKTPTSEINQHYDQEELFSSHNSTKPNTSTQIHTVSNSELQVDVCDSNTKSESCTSTNSDTALKKSKKAYKPAYKSGGYAILVTLLKNFSENPNVPALKKEDLIEKAQTYCEESFIRPKPGSYYTAWSNINTLISKGLVKKPGKKKKEYSLTDKGKELARNLIKDTENRPSVNDIIFNEEPSGSDVIVEQNDNIIVDNEVPSTSDSINVDVIEMEPGSFDIILLIDKNETGGLKKKNDPTVAEFKKYPDFKHEYRSLKVGDFAWIARSKVNNDQELVLPFVVERKRMDDLAASLKDGRYREQKFRLRKCGLKNVIYMVEDYGNNKHVGMPIQSLMQALANTRVQDGFKVHTTKSLNHSVRFLAMMTKRLSIRFKDKHLRGCCKEPIGEYLMTFEYFNKSSAKNKALTVTETFIKLLLQLKGLSVEKALAITKKYPTPRSLIKAYSKCNPKESEYLLAYLKYGHLNRNVGHVNSKIVYELFSSSFEL